VYRKHAGVSPVLQRLPVAFRQELHSEPLFSSLVKQQQEKLFCFIICRYGILSSQNVFSLGIVMYFIDMKILRDIEQVKLIGRNIATFRKKQGLTQQQLAEQMGLRQPVLASYEVGRRSIPVVLVPCVARILNVSTEDILGLRPYSKNKKPGPQSKLEKQIECVQQLPRSAQRYVSVFLDQVLANAQRQL
jgi:transcriptional regulator with XRE-family HTH domain